jgi:hypothetical protein
VLAKRVGEWSRSRIASEGEPQLFGSWAPYSVKTERPMPPALPLQVSFDYTRNISSSYEEWLTEQYPAYPCPQPPETRRECYDLQLVTPGALLSNPWTHPSNPTLEFHQVGGPSGFEVLDTAPDVVEARTHAIYLADLETQELLITFPEPVANVVLFLLAVDEGRRQPGWSVGLRPRWSQPLRLSARPRFARPRRPPPIAGSPGAGPDTGRLRGKDVYFGLCYDIVPVVPTGSSTRRDRPTAERDRPLERRRNVLEPHTLYQLTVQTR